MRVCVCIHTHICIHVYIYIYIHNHNHTTTNDTNKHNNAYHNEDIHDITTNHINNYDHGMINNKQI